jgi:hypothetical protein
MKKRNRTLEARKPAGKLGFLLLLLSAFTFAFTPARAQTQEEDTPAEEEEYFDEEEENYDDEAFQGGDVYENTIDLDDTEGNYKLDDATAQTFQTMTSMERENAIIKLRIEQGKLKLDLEKQKAEKRKLDLAMADDEKTRELKREEQERKAEQERKKAEEEAERSRSEQEKKKREEEINRQIMTKLQTVDFSNPDEVNAVTQLMAMVPGNDRQLSSITNNANKSQQAPKDTMTFEDKYAIKTIIGAGGNLVATIENKEKKSTFKVSSGSMMDGWTVDSVKNSSILLKKDGLSKVMYLN